MGAAIPIIMLGATVLSTVVGVGSAMSQGQMAQEAAEAQADSQRIQGELAELNARSEAAEMQNEATRLKSRQMTQAAGSGVSLDSGSFMAIVADSANKANLDREQVLRTGRLNRAAAEAGASMSSFEGGMRRSAGYAQAGSTLLSGVTSSMKIGDKAGWFD